MSDVKRLHIAMKATGGNIFHFMDEHPSGGYVRYEEIERLERECAELRKQLEWQPIETAPKDGAKILAWCVHDADPHSLDEGKTLTIYGGHCEVVSHVPDGPNLVQWCEGDSERDEYSGELIHIPAWWFSADRDGEAANPMYWMPIKPPVEQKEPE